MSVINNMLRDLDQRQGRSGAPAASSDAVRSVAAAPAGGLGMRGLLLVAVALMCGAGAAWWLQEMRRQPVVAPLAEGQVSAATSNPPKPLDPVGLPASPPPGEKSAAPETSPAAATPSPASPVTTASPSMAPASAPLATSVAAASVAPAPQPALAAAPALAIAPAAAPAPVPAARQVAAAPTAVVAVPRPVALAPAPARPLSATTATPAPAAPSPAKPVEPVALPPAIKPEVVAAAVARPAPAAVRPEAGKVVSARQASANLVAEAALLERQGRGDEARGLLQRALAISPADPAARQALVQIHLDSGRWDEAQALLVEGQRLNPDQPGAAQALARLQVERGDVPGAIQTLEAARAQRDDPAIRAFLGALMLRTQRAEEAVAHYLVALRADPNNASWLVGAGAALEATGRAADAGEAYRRAAAAPGLTADMSSFLTDRLARLQGGARGATR